MSPEQTVDAEHVDAEDLEVLEVGDGGAGPSMLIVRAGAIEGQYHEFRFRPTEGVFIPYEETKTTGEPGGLMPDVQARNPASVPQSVADAIEAAGWEMYDDVPIRDIEIVESLGVDDE